MKTKSRKILLALLTSIAMLGCMVTSASAYGPVLVYQPPSTLPSYGVQSPRAVQLQYSGSNNGKMYATWEQLTSSGVPTFPIYESTNNGQTWAKVGDVKNTVDASNWGMQNCPQLFEMPQTIGSLTAGTLICVGDACPTDLSATKMEMYKSTDLGRTWTYVSTVATGGANSMLTHSAIWEPWMLVANNKLICYYSDERDVNHSQKLVHETTTDGVNWSSLVEDAVWNDSTSRPGMPVVAKMANGNYIMSFELPGSIPHYKINTNPETGWNTCTSTAFLSSGSPYVTVLSDGRIIADSNGSGDIFINTKNDGTGTWEAMGTPMGAAYSRELLELANGRLFIVKGGGYSSLNNITCGDMYVPPVTGSYTLVNVKSGKALAIGGGTTSDGVQAIQWTKDGSTPEKWQLVTNGSYKEIINCKTGKALTVSQASTADGASVIQWNDTSTNEFQWSLVQSGSYYKIVNRNSGKVLDVYQSSTADGGIIDQYTDNGGTNQLWQLVAN